MDRPYLAELKALAESDVTTSPFLKAAALAITEAIDAQTGALVALEAERRGA